MWKQKNISTKNLSNGYAFCNLVAYINCKMINNGFTKNSCNMLYVPLLRKHCDWLTENK